MSAPNLEGKRDDLGRELAQIGEVGRVVSLVPSISELIFELGAGSRLVGISTFCTEPAEAVAGVEKVGGTKNPDCGRILALEPDLVFLDRDENRVEDFEVFDAAGIPVFVANPRTVSDAATTVRRIGVCLGVGERASEIEADLLRSLQLWSAGEPGPVRVFCPIWRNPWMCFNQQVFAGDMIRRAGGENVCDSDEMYRRVLLSDVAEKAPEVILLPDEPYLFRSEQIEALRELHATPAWSSGRIHIVDGKGLFWYGTRTAPALRSLTAILAAARQS